MHCFSPLLKVGEDVLGRSELYCSTKVPRAMRLLTVASLATIEMKALLKEIYSRFETTPAEEMKADMTIDDQIIASRPKNQTCLMKFEVLG